MSASVRAGNWRARPHEPYIRVMRGVRKKERTWEIRRLKGTPAAFMGLVNAPDEKSAVKTAIKKFEIRAEDHNRLIAVQRQ